jgi:FG-GAP-like repeat
MRCFTFLSLTRMRALGALGAFLAMMPVVAQAQLTVTGLSPARQAQAARTANVALTFSQSVNAGSTAGVRVFSALTGRKTGTISTAGATVTVNPTADFRFGDELMVTVPSTVLSTTNVAATRLVYQFQALTGAGPGTFGGFGSAPTRGRAGVFVMGDVDNDGDLDLVNNAFGDPGETSVAFNAGNGTFAGNLGTVTLGPHAGELKLGDVDGDGDVDLVAAVGASGGGVGFLNVRFNNGAGVFGGNSSLQLGGLPNALVLGDFDGDGDLDAATTSANTSKVSIRVNNGGGTFSGTQEVVVGAGARGLLLGDLNADGDLDLLVPNLSDNTVSVLSNNGTGTFSVTTPISTASLRNVALGDVDGDGDLDLLSADGTATSVNLRRNNGAGTFAAPTAIAVGYLPQKPALADVDGDGDLDLVVTGSNTTGIRLNNGAGTFSGSHNTANFTLVGPPRDVDGDGDLDLMETDPATQGGGGRLFFRFNQSAPTVVSFTPTSGPVGTVVTITGTNLTGTTNVQFSGTSPSFPVSATFTVVNATTITATVPAGAQTGPIIVGSAVSSGSFTVLPVPTVTTFTPPSGPVGTTVTITGTNLDVATSVKFNGTGAAFTVVSPTTITAIVPPGATSGPITIVAPGSSVTTTTSFIVTVITTPVTLAVDSVLTTPGTTVVLPVRAREFTTIVALQSTLQYDPAQLTLVAVEQVNPALTGTNQHITFNPGQVRNLWVAATNSIVTLPNDAVLYALKFTVSPTAVAGARLKVRWVSAGTPLEVTRATLLPAPVSALDGSVRIGTGATVSGLVRTGNNTPVAGVTMTLAGAATPPAQVTSATGAFTLTSGLAGQNYVLSPSKANDVTVTNGVTVTDVVLIQRHILAAQLLGAAHKVVSADVNNDRVVTVTDAILVQDFILGNTNAFTGGALWRFYSSSQSFANPNLPGVLQTGRTYTSLANATNQNFVACKLGDVNDSWNPAIPRPATSGAAVGLTIGSGPMAVVTGQRIRVPVSVALATTLIGMQGTLQWDSTVLRLVAATPARAGVLLNPAAAASGLVSFIWSDPSAQPQALTPADTLLWLELDVIGAAGTTATIDLTSTLTPALAVDAAFDSAPLTATPGTFTVGAPTGLTATVASAARLEAWPNPAHVTVRVVAAAGTSTVSLVDATGRVVLTVVPAADGTAVLPLGAVRAGVYLVRAGAQARRLVVE